MGLGDYYQLAKAKVRTRKIQARHTRALTRQIGPEGIVGAKSYNANYKTLRKAVKKHDIEGAKTYITNQKAKIRTQTSDGYMKK